MDEINLNLVELQKTRSEIKQIDEKLVGYKAYKQFLDELAL